MSESTNPNTGSDNARPHLDDEGWEALFSGEPETDELSDDNADEANEEETDDQDIEELDNENEDDDADDEESDESDEDDKSEDDEDDENDAADESEKFTLKSGEEVTLQELEDGYLREVDYRRKTQDIGNLKKEVDTEKSVLQEQYSTLQTKMDNLVHHLANSIPPEPPLELAHSNPTEHYNQTVFRNAKIAELEQVLAVKDDVNKDVTQMSDDQLQSVKDEQKALLLDHMPHLKDPAKEAQFHKKIAETAEHLGFSKEEIERNGPLDERVLRSLHFASIGLQAVASRKTARKKVAAMKKSAAGGKRTKSAVPDRISKAVKHYKKSGDVSAREAITTDYWSQE